MTDQMLSICTTTLPVLCPTVSCGAKLVRSLLTVEWKEGMDECGEGIEGWDGGKGWMGRRETMDGGKGWMVDGGKGWMGGGKGWMRWRDGWDG